ncbi:MAG: helix-hairpin-helix domain-containing protein [Lachnospiraceae bacterium]|nr:helix-hairpin-helix domain-containing protein [Lachnospiraceae bacterium]MDE6698365.1 helix-hairpin-helix domain-containing protein [Lachnospiraceae bacterium]
MLKRNNIKYLAVVIAICVAGFVHYLKFCESDITINVKDGDTTTAYDAVETSDNTINNIICVYITGCISVPGVYEVPKDSRIVSVVEAAGGLLEEADTRLVNMAKEVSDGEHIHIYSIYDEVEDESDRYSDLININTATKSELMTLKGIGETRAESIIEYRDKCGGFNSIEDIMLVSGIKESAFEKIKDYICVK